MYFNASIDAGRTSYMKHTGESQQARRSIAFLVVTILPPNIGIGRHMAKTNQTYRMGWDETLQSLINRTRGRYSFITRDGRTDNSLKGYQTRHGSVYILYNIGPAFTLGYERYKGASQITGRAYAHGLMAGEAMNGWKKRV